MDSIRSVLYYSMCCIIALSMGCAYRMGNYGRQFPGGYKYVSVPVFKNSTPEVGIEGLFTNALIQEIERSRLGSVVLKNESEVIVFGTITDVQFVPAGLVSEKELSNLPRETALATSYTVKVKAYFEIKRKVDESVLWKGSVNGARSYSAPKVAMPVINTVNPIYNHSARHQTLGLIANDMMSEALDQMTENF